MSNFVELLEEFMRENKIREPESYNDLMTIVRAIGYSSITDFLSQHAGALQSLVNWLADSDNPEATMSIVDWLYAYGPRAPKEWGDGLKSEMPSWGYGSNERE